MGQRFCRLLCAKIWRREAAKDGSPSPGLLEADNMKIKTQENIVDDLEMEIPTKKEISHLMFICRKDELLIREPGTIDFQSFLIDECENCDIYLLDTTAQVMVDACKNCNIFISPCESSIYLRNCENCRIVCMCQQFRARDCLNLDIMLHVASSFFSGVILRETQRKNRRCLF